MADNFQLIKSLLMTAGTLQNWVVNPPFLVSGDPVVILKTSSLPDLADLLLKAATALMEKSA